LRADKFDHGIDAIAAAQIGEDKRALAAHAFGIGGHHIQIGADVRGQIGLVDNQQIGAGDAGAAFAGDFFTAGDIDDIQREIG
jgi:hypothetical protein